MPNTPNYEHLVKLVGDERALNNIPLKSLLDSGATVTLSSDWDVSTNDPFAGMANALFRDPQSITMKVPVVLSINY